MYKTKSELYELVSDLMTKDEYETEIKKRFEEYEGLLSEEAISYLIIDELKRNIVETTTISEFKDKESVSLEVRVEDIGGPREFKRKNGSLGQVVNITVFDKTGKCRLTLWGKDVETVKNKIIKIDSKIKIVNGFVKITDFGPEINIGRWGLFFVDGKKVTQ
ncbi:MAG: DNA-binding protein [Thermoplasmata archaeon]|nr:MAG: DNA-binding protein [Thermoplasmata archaeon]